MSWFRTRSQKKQAKKRPELYDCEQGEDREPVYSNGIQNEKHWDQVPRVVPSETESNRIRLDCIERKIETILQNQEVFKSQIDIIMKLLLNHQAPLPNTAHSIQTTVQTTNRQPATNPHITQNNSKSLSKTTGSKWLPSALSKSLSQATGPGHASSISNPTYNSHYKGRSALNRGEDQTYMKWMGTISSK